MFRKVSPEYGHMHLSIFYRRKLQLGSGGFLLKKTFYPWSSLRRIEVWQQPWPGFGPGANAKLLPRARIHLSDGTGFVLRGDVLVKRGSRVEPGYATAFDELVAKLREMLQAELGNSKEGEK